MNGSSVPLWTYPPIWTAIKQDARCDGEGREVTRRAFMHEMEFSRRSFRKGGGALVRRFPACRAPSRGQAAAKAMPPACRTSTRTQTIITDFSQVDTYIAIHPDNT